MLSEPATESMFMDSGRGASRATAGAVDGPMRGNGFLRSNHARSSLRTSGPIRVVGNSPVNLADTTGLIHSTK